MEKKLNTTGLKAAILTMSFLQMATNAIAAILADISAEFPEASTVAVQYLMTFPNLLVVGMSIVTARLSVHVPKKLLAIAGLCASLLAGIGSFLFHGSIVLLYCWAGMLGIGIGLALPGIVFTMLFVPKRNAAMQEQSKRTGKAGIRIPKEKWFYFAVAAVFMLLFYMGPTNLAMFVGERGIGNTMTVGTAATILLLGGTLMGLIFGKVASRMGKYTITLGFLMLAAGFFMLYTAKGLSTLYLGSFLVGTSNTLALPQCMGSVVTQDKEQSTFLMSAVFATANLGTFLAPALTGVSAAVMGNDMASSRFLFTGGAAVVCMVLSIIGIRFQVILE